MFFFVLALLYLFGCLNECKQHSGRLQLLKTSVGNVIRLKKKRIITNCRALHFCLLDRPLCYSGVLKVERNINNFNNFFIIY